MRYSSAISRRIPSFSVNADDPVIEQMKPFIRKVHIFMIMSEKPLPECQSVQDCFKKPIHPAAMRIFSDVF